MARYRITFRYGPSQTRYEILDLEAGGVREALRAAAEQVSDEVAGTAELVEVRVQGDPDDREYVEG